MKKALLLFDKSHEHIEGIIASLGEDGYEVHGLTPNHKKYLQLEDAGYSVTFVQNVISPESAYETDRLCYELIGSAFKKGASDYSEYAGISFGALSEYTLTPHFIKIYRFIFAISTVLESLKPDKVFIVGTDGFAGAAKAVAEGRGIAASLIKGGLPIRVINGLKNLYRAKKTRWIETEFKNLFLEWVLEVCLLLNGIRWKIARGNGPVRNKYRLIFAGDTYSGYPLYEHFRDMEGWQMNICGMDYRLRKRIFKDVFPMEGFFEPAMLLKAAGSFFHFLKVWLKMRSDREFHKKFVLMGTGFWKIMRKTLRNYCLILFPRLYLDYLISSRAFSRNPGKTILVLPFDVMPYTKTLVTAAKAKGAKSLVIQHGILAEPNGHDRIFADYVAGWGGESARWYERFGNDPAKVILTGNPRYDKYFTAKTMDRSKILERLGISPDRKVVTVITDWNQEFSVSSSELNVAKMIRATMTAVGKLRLDNTVHVLIKIHPSETIEKYEEEYRRFKDVFPPVSIVRDNIEEILFVSDLLIADLSSTIVEAMFFGSPSILFISCRRINIPLVESMEERGVILFASDEEELGQALRSLLFDERAKDEIIGRHKAFLEDYIYSLDSGSTERVCMAIERLVKENVIGGKQHPRGVLR